MVKNKKNDIEEVGILSAKNIALENTLNLIENSLIYQLRTLDIRIAILLDKMTTNAEECISEYRARRKDEGGFKEPELVTEKGERIKIKEIIHLSSKEKYEKKIEGTSGAEKWRRSGPGHIEFHHSKNTRGNVASIEATLGAAIACAKSAKIGISPRTRKCYLESYDVELTSPPNDKLSSKVLYVF